MFVCSHFYSLFINNNYYQFPETTAAETFYSSVLHMMNPRQRPTLSSLLLQPQLSESSTVTQADLLCTTRHWTHKLPQSLRFTTNDEASTPGGRQTSSYSSDKNGTKMKSQQSNAVQAVCRFHDCHWPTTGFFSCHSSTDSEDKRDLLTGQQVHVVVLTQDGVSDVSIQQITTSHIDFNSRNQVKVMHKREG